MATFTIELRSVVEIVGKDNIGLDNYPIFDEGYRETLNKNIREHFWYREIGLETIDQFVFKMRQRMNLIMPPYNKLYQTTYMEFDPLTTTKLTTHVEGTGVESGNTTANSSSTATNNSSTDSKSRAVNSDFPQSQLSDNGDYATAASDSNANTEAESNASDEALQETIAQATRESASDTTMEGYTSSPSDLILKYRDTLINVDRLIISELEDLFMGLFDNGDELGDYPTMSYPYYYLGVF